MKKRLPTCICGVLGEQEKKNQLANNRMRIVNLRFRSDKTLTAVQCNSQITRALVIPHVYARSGSEICIPTPSSAAGFERKKHPSSWTYLAEARTSS
eukprot:500501-Prorocentrum_minimum.AAC.6